MSSPSYVYSPSYGVDLGGHVFPTHKYARIAARLRAEGHAVAEDFIQPDLPSADDVERVHTQRYHRACREGTLTAAELARLELPWSAALFKAAVLAIGGSIRAARLAIEHGVGLHIGGGFHHAFPDHGEGFCVFHDVATAIRALQASADIETAVVIDTDLHHGNGTAAIFADDPRVATFSIHERDIYPLDKPHSDIDVGVAAWTGDARYLQQLNDGLERFVSGRTADLAVYVAGADPYAQDQLGSLQISKDGLLERDRQVIECCRALGWPVLTVLAGGYALDPEDTVDIQLRTLLCAAELWRD